ncbi:OLC1v1010337C1 [Oldenlandia corymbosa var. corymbosa]|uniref:OLC1v1010337C1 n=1 Tax=Oldenlandia corymbosa var. corymbosa TaxID=529605 RepID=A0AAV1DR54_OLDCO|nr:OLC1v1010337C1 [Oldenlandia corymbosa var. corymbosa]
MMMTLVGSINKDSAKWLIGWNDMLEEPGVKAVLFVRIGIQMLQQFSGIHYYAPQILEQAGVGVILSNYIGIISESASILISAFMTLLMLPAIAIAMRLMDISGRRTLLLTTIPVLILTLVVLALFGGNIVDLGKVANAVVSTVCVVAYSCFFVMGIGPVPGILCAEMFPTRVRGICITICTMAFWIGDIVVTYTFPVMMSSIGLGAVFGLYAVVCVLSWFFVFKKVPETKGMSLEAISEFFSLGAKASTKENDPIVASFVCIKT